jgi:hypothetical protein
VMKLALRPGHTLAPGSLLLEVESPQGDSAAGGIRSIGESNDQIGNRTRDLLDPHVTMFLVQPNTFHLVHSV